MTQSYVLCFVDYFPSLLSDSVEQASVADTDVVVSAEPKEDGRSGKLTL